MFGIVLSVTVQPVQAQVTLHPFGSTPYNATMSDWLERYWNWTLSIPVSEHPRGDMTGKNCGLKQNGPVWFLDPPIEEGRTERLATCKIPEGKTIFVPLLVAECGYNVDVDVKTDQAITECTKAGNNGGNIKLAIDGKQLLLLNNTSEKDYEKSTRVLSDIFTINSVKNNIFDDPEGVDRKRADGYFAMIEPLPVGNHTVKLDVQILPLDYAYHLIMTYNLNIEANSTTNLK